MFRKYIRILTNIRANLELLTNVNNLTKQTTRSIKPKRVVYFEIKY